jgi:hypothetical protein
MDTDIESDTEIRVVRPRACALRAEENATVVAKKSSCGYLARGMARDSRAKANY